MITVLKQGSTQAIINELLIKLFEKKQTKGIDAKKYCGVLKLKDDAVKIQKQMRDEWE
jgi:hypothetical protein